MIDVKVFVCESNCYHDKVSHNTHAIFLPVHKTPWEPILFENISDINILIEKLLEQLPSPHELTDDDFEVKKTLIVSFLFNFTLIKNI